LIKRYLTETGRNWVLSLVDPGAGNTITIVEILKLRSQQHWLPDIALLEALVVERVMEQLICWPYIVKLSTNLLPLAGLSWIGR
jgi:hypothetical protein